MVGVIINVAHCRTAWKIHVAQCDGVGFPSLRINERLIPAYLTMLHEKECYVSHLSSGWHGFLGIFLGIFLGLRPWEIPRKTHAIPCSDEKSTTCRQ